MTEPNQERFSRRAVRSFVLRQGRMGTGQHKALAELGPHFILPYLGIAPRP